MSRRDIRPREIADPYAQRDTADENDSVPQADGDSTPLFPVYCRVCGIQLQSEFEPCPRCD